MRSERFLLSGHFVFSAVRTGPACSFLAGPAYSSQRNKVAENEDGKPWIAQLEALNRQFETRALSKKVVLREPEAGALAKDPGGYDERGSCHNKRAERYEELARTAGGVPCAYQKRQ